MIGSTAFRSKLRFVVVVAVVVVAGAIFHRHAAYYGSRWNIVVVTTRATTADSSSRDAHGSRSGQRVTFLFYGDAHLEGYSLMLSFCIVVYRRMALSLQVQKKK